MKVRWQDGVVGILVFAMAGHAYNLFKTLDGPVPSHFNAMGVADDFSEPSFLWFFPGFSFGIYLFLRAMTLVNNLSDQRSTELSVEKKEQVLDVAREMMVNLGLIIVVFMGWSMYKSVAVAQNPEKNTSDFGLVVFLLALFGYLIYSSINMSRLYGEKENK